MVLNSAADQLEQEDYICIVKSSRGDLRPALMFTMPGRNRKNRGPGRNDFQRAETHDHAPNHPLRPPRPFGAPPHDGARRRSHGQTHPPSSGIHRVNDNSNAGLSARFRSLKQRSDVVKRELEDLISQIDELQPDAAAMDWSGSAGTIVYVPIPCAPDGSFQHAQVRSMSPGEYPNGVAAFLAYSETGDAAANHGNRADAPVAFTPYTESMRDRTSSGTTMPSASRWPRVAPGDGSVSGSGVPISEFGRASASNPCERVVRPAAAQDDMFRCGLPSVDGGQPQVRTYTTPEICYSEGGGSLGMADSKSHMGGQRSIQARSTTAPKLLTPPASPVEAGG